MKLNLYVVYDRILKQSWTISEARNDGMALRNFAKVCGDNEYATDFELYCVGVFDHDSMEGMFHAPLKVEVTMDTEVEEEEDAL